jgi:DNA-binding CsgD family transcriptional regulator
MVAVKTKRRRRKTKTQRLVELLLENGCMTLEEICAELEINTNTFHSLRNQVAHRKKNPICIRYNEERKTYGIY